MAEGTTTLAIQHALDRLRAGDSQAKPELINRAYERLLIVTRRLLRSFGRVRVEEETTGLLNEAYLRLHTALEAVKPSSVREFIGLASLQVRRVLLDTIRKMNRRPRPGNLDGAPGHSDQPSPDDALPDPVPHQARLDMTLDLLEAIEGLPDEEREVVELLFFHGWSQPEAGELLGVHEDTVKRRWTRARIKLAGKLTALAPER